MVETQAYKNLAIEARKQTSLSQRDFAQLLGVHYTTIAHWETGHKPPTGSAIALLRIIQNSPQLAIEILQNSLY